MEANNIASRLKTFRIWQQLAERQSGKPAYFQQGYGSANLDGSDPTQDRLVLLQQDKWQTLTKAIDWWLRKPIDDNATTRRQDIINAISRLDSAQDIVRLLDSFLNAGDRLSALARQLTRYWLPPASRRKKTTSQQACRHSKAI